MTSLSCVRTSRCSSESRKVATLCWSFVSAFHAIRSRCLSQIIASATRIRRTIVVEFYAGLLQVHAGAQNSTRKSSTFRKMPSIHLSSLSFHQDIQRFVIYGQKLLAIIKDNSAVLYCGYIYLSQHSNQLVPASPLS